MKYVCELCGSVYDEAAGDPRHGIPAGTAFSDLPADYECSGCGSALEAFYQPQKSPATAALKQRSPAFWREAKYHDGSGESDR